jgi:hypothetical protein
MKTKPFLFIFYISLACVFAGCGPSKAERDATERQRLELEEKARLDTEKANKAITGMTEKAFRQRTPEEEAKHQAEVKRQAQEMIDAQKKADAAATPAKP